MSDWKCVLWRTLLIHLAQMMASNLVMVERKTEGSLIYWLWKIRKIWNNQRRLWWWIRFFIHSKMNKCYTVCSLPALNSGTDKSTSFQWTVFRPKRIMFERACDSLLFQKCQLLAYFQKIEFDCYQIPSFLKLLLWFPRHGLVLAYFYEIMNLKIMISFVLQDLKVEMVVLLYM